MMRSAATSRSSSAALSLTGAIALALLAGACGGGGDDGVVVSVDAAIDALAIDASSCQGMVCGGECIDTSLDEEHCGGCTTVCDPGQACQASVCACPPSFVPAMPSFVQQQVDATILPGATLGIGGMLNSTIDAIIVAYPTANVQVNRNYDLSGAQPGTPPFVAAGYDIDLDTFEPSASFYATRGTLRFSEVCPAGFKGTLTAGHFVAVAGLMNPTLVPNGCAFDVPLLTFAYGDACPAQQ
jgi:hypothetical protein